MPLLGDSPRSSPSPPPAGRAETVLDPVRVAVFVAIYFFSGRLGLSLAFLHQSASPVWPPTGIAIAAVLLLGYRIWPGIWLSAFLVNVTTSGSIPATAGIATGNTLEALIGVFLVRRFAGGRRAFERAPDILKFMLLAATLATTVSATFGVTSLSLVGLAPWGGFWPIWTTWWLGDLVSAVIIAPLIVIWVTSPLPRWPRRRIVEAAATLALIVGTGLVVFGRAIPTPFDGFPPSFLTIPALLWAAFRFGQRGAVTAAFALSVVAIWGTMRGADPLFGTDPNRALLNLQAFLGTVTVTNLVLGALVSERDRVEDSLRRSREELRRQFDELEHVYRTAPIGMALMDAGLRFVRINDRLAAINGRRAVDHIGRSLREVIPELADTVEPILLSVIMTGEPSVNHEIVGTTPAEPGVERAWLASYYPIRGAHGLVHGVGVVVQDIAPLRKAQAEMTA